MIKKALKTRLHLHSDLFILLLASSSRSEIYNTNSHEDPHSLAYCCRFQLQIENQKRFKALSVSNYGQVFFLDLRHMMIMNQCIII